MHTFIAFCENASCGAVFGVPNLVGGSGSATLHMTEIRVGTCPVCGGLGRVPDGVYDYTNNVVQFIRGPKQSLSALQKIEKLLRDAGRVGASREQIVDQVRRISPDTAKAIESAPSVAALQQWILIAIAVVRLAILVHTTYFKRSDEALQREFIDHLIQENNRLRSAPDEAKKARPYRRAGPKVQRNALCTCGSGKKYKRCCGAPGG